MSNIKCPFCQQELRNCCAGVIYTCSNPDSCPHEQCYGSKELWQELIRTRKALEKAIWWLNEIVENHRCTPISTAEKALAEIKQIVGTKE